MAATFEPIASTTLGSAATGVTFASISAGWTDLVVHYAVLHDSGSANLLLRFNGDSGTNYSMTIVSGNGSAASSTRRTSNSYGAATWNATPTTTNWSVGTLSVMGYSNSSVYSTFLSESANAGVAVERIVGLWSSTSAITSIEMFAGGSSNFAAGSTFSLYGIKAA